MKVFSLEDGGVIGIIIIVTGLGRDAIEIEIYKRISIDVCVAGYIGILVYEHFLRWVEDNRFVALVLFQFDTFVFQ